MLSMCEFQSLLKKFIAQINRSVLRFKNFPLILRGHNYKKDDFLCILNPWKWAVQSFEWKRFPVFDKRVQKFKH